MAYNKIKINQIDMPEVISNDLTVSETSSGYHFGLGFPINHDINISGSLTVNGVEIYGNKSYYDPYVNSVLCGYENIISGGNNSVIRGNENLISGEKNIILNGNNNSFYYSDFNAVIAGSNVTFSNSKGSVVIASNNEEIKEVKESSSLYLYHENIYVYGDTHFEKSVSFNEKTELSKLVVSNSLVASSIKSSDSSIFYDKSKFTSNSQINGETFFGEYTLRDLTRKNQSNKFSEIKISGENVATKQWIEDKNFTTGLIVMRFDEVDVSGDFVLDHGNLIEYNSVLNVMGDVIAYGSTGEETFLLNDSTLTANNFSCVSGYVLDKDSSEYINIASADWLSGQGYSSSDEGISTGFYTEGNINISKDLYLTGQLNVNSGFDLHGNYTNSGASFIGGNLNVSGDSYIKNIYITGSLSGQSLYNESSLYNISGVSLTGESMDLKDSTFMVTGSEVIRESYLLENYLLYSGISNFKNCKFNGVSLISGVLNFYGNTKVSDFYLNGHCEFSSDQVELNNISGDFHVEDVLGELNFNVEQCNLADLQGVVDVTIKESFVDTGINSYYKQNDIIDINLYLTGKNEIKKVWERSSSYSPYNQTFNYLEDSGDWWKSMYHGLTGYETEKFENKIKEISPSLYKYDEACLEGWIEWLAINEPLKNNDVTGYMTTESQVKCAIDQELESLSLSGLELENLVLFESNQDVQEQADWLVSGCDIELKNKQVVEYRVDWFNNPSANNINNNFGGRNYYPRIRIK
jgi:hypothetical protein